MTALLTGSRTVPPSSLRRGDRVVRHAETRTVAWVVRQLDDVVVHYADGGWDTFGIGTTVMRRAS